MRTGKPGDVRRVLLRALAVLGVIGILCAIPAVRSWLSREHICELTRAIGAFGPAVLILAGIVGPVFFVPRAPICLVAGLLYGVAIGSVVGIVSGTAGSIVHYYLSMGLLAHSAERLTPKRWQRSLTVLKSHPFRALLLLRLFPLSNASVINMIAGLLRLPFFPFLSATVLGTLPITIIYALWGKTASQPSRLHVALSLGLLLVLTLAAWLVPRVRGFQR
ncbi:MAG: TVP38/TMEM64 family protein [Kiritimatiellae bacterium]|nr:TVP38/TMEM64 family protein [Kiritimatiellia bacterium]